ncbi:hypothetical protein KVT40_002415 [Elsinoe batatas]|uniref:Uncharacterized protein n=1 Tax=Elsinoe batatas TaxID=2601811 RepID=A0A8K0PI59_9PEZI|nr:hypothetical protein KVT40_002415 [Elsinoe batatas]
MHATTQYGPGQPQHGLCESPSCQNSAVVYMKGGDAWKCASCALVHYEMMVMSRTERKGTMPPPGRLQQSGNRRPRQGTRRPILSPSSAVELITRNFSRKYRTPLRPPLASSVAKKAMHWSGILLHVREYHCERYRQRKTDKDNPPADGLCTYFGGGHCKTAFFYWDVQKRRWLCEKHANPTYLAREKKKRALREKNRNKRPRGKWFCKEHFVNESTIELADKREQNRDKPTASCAWTRGCKVKPTVWNEELGVWHCVDHAKQVGSSTRKAIRGKVMLPATGDMDEDGDDHYAPATKQTGSGTRKRSLVDTLMLHPDSGQSELTATPAKCKE